MFCFEIRLNWYFCVRLVVLLTCVYSFFNTFLSCKCICTHPICSLIQNRVLVYQTASHFLREAFILFAESLIGEIYSENGLRY